MVIHDYLSFICSLQHCLYYSLQKGKRCLSVLALFFLKFMNIMNSESSWRSGPWFIISLLFRFFSNFLKFPVNVCFANLELFVHSVMLKITQQCLPAQVSHHPMIVACHCEGIGWKFWGDSNLKSKFWGRSIQLDPLGILTLEFDDGEVFQWSKVFLTSTWDSLHPEFFFFFFWQCFQYIN